MGWVGGWMIERKRWIRWVGWWVEKETDLRHQEEEGRWRKRKGRRGEEGRWVVDRLLSLLSFCLEEEERGVACLLLLFWEGERRRREEEEEEEEEVWFWRDL